MTIVRRTLILLLTACLAALATTSLAQVTHEETYIVGEDTVTFVVQLPSGYSVDSPCAIIVAWHAWGADQYEFFANSDFEVEANLRGWMLAGFLGPSYTHWNHTRAQRHCKVMLDSIYAHYPFSRDSIYMIGGSMGGAAGQVWHVNNCGSDDYLIAATAGASQIIDTYLRAEQYLAENDTNRSMRDEFGGLPGASDSVDYEYHRASAIFFADTTESMHFNALTVPVWSTWGNTDIEWYAYGLEALEYRGFYRPLDPDLNEFFPTDIPRHGIFLMWPVGVCNWLSRYSVNRYPDQLSIAADNDDDYYYTTAELGDEPYTFGRFGVTKDAESRELDILLLRNIERLAVNFDFPWGIFDTLWGTWENRQPEIDLPWIVLRHAPPVDTVYRPDGVPFAFVRLDTEVQISLPQSGEYVVTFEPVSAPERLAPLVEETRLLAAYPNPFNGDVTLEIAANRAQTGTLVLYDLLGRVQKSAQVRLAPGIQSYALDAGDLPSGSYFVALKEAASPPLRITHLK